MTSVTAPNEFGLRILRALPKDKNTFISPLSISAALALTHSGARGYVTPEVLAKGLGVESKDVRSLRGLLDELATDPLAVIELASKVFLNEGGDNSSIPEGVPVETMPFSQQPDACRLRINTWVEDTTRNRISDLLGPGTISTLTRLVLANAVYFKGTWETQFDPKKTYEGRFTTTSGVVMASLMRGEFEANYAQLRKTPTEEGLDLQILDLPYQGRYSMVLLLPGVDSSLDELEKNLTANNLHSWRGYARPTKVDITIPKFRVAGDSISLKDIMRDLGLGHIFGEDADFSGFGPDLAVDDVVHKGFIDVNEEGSEAAAATAMMMKCRGMGMSKPCFYATRPFLFAIVDKETSALMFAGRLVDPTKA